MVSLTHVKQGKMEVVTYFINRLQFSLAICETKLSPDEMSQIFVED